MLAKVTITVLGIGLIILINWYFLFSRRKAKPAAASVKTDLQEIRVVVKGGYTPDTIVVKKSIPVRLNFYRDESADCSETVVFGDFSIRKSLPAFQTTPVEFTPDKEGEFVFTCGMGMLKGKLIVR